jgi:phage terminase large subunit-like protein
MDLTISHGGELLGAQRPRHLWVPEYDSSSGEEAIELAEMAGLHPDEWQRFVVTHMLGERAGKWAAFEVALEVARQNGKGGVYEIRELAGLFLFGEELLIHSAHEYKTAEQALDRMELLIGGCPDLSRRVRTIKRSHGQEGIYLTTGQVLRYATRTASALRGFSCDFLGIDEAMVIKHSMHSAVFPTMSARPNAQILYAGSAVDQLTMEHGQVFARLRQRGIDGSDPRLAYFGWSAPFDHPDDVTEEAASDPANWAAANPAMGIRISPEYIAMEQRALGARGFAVERLGVGDWPEVDAEGLIDLEQWRSRTDTASKIAGPVCFSVDVTPARTMSAISAAGRRADDRSHIEVVEHRAGTGWVAERVEQLVEAHDAVWVGLDAAGPAGSLLPDLQERGITVHEVTAREHAQACGVFVDAIENDALRHLGTQELEGAVRGAAKRPLGDAWAWSRKHSAVDISPLVSCTLALWGSENSGGGDYLMTFDDTELALQGDEESEDQ